MGLRAFSITVGCLALAVAAVAVLGLLEIIEPEIFGALVAGLAAALLFVAGFAWRGPRASKQTEKATDKKKSETPSALGGYRLVEMLGKGGMGEVWRADHETLIRPAAIKLMRGELLGLLPPRELAELKQRFRREVQLTALLSSPHTVAVFDHGQTADHTVYYVMELLHGVDLEHLVHTYGPQPPERVVHLMQQVCRSLAEAHNRKLIHRDIKPANIYICAVGMEVDFAKVLDFGLVRDLGGGDQRLTMEGATPGTPAYLAPESLDDKLESRSDLYALGCVAYYLLTGRLVFDAETRVAMLAAHRSEKPAAPSRRTELPIPAELDAIVLSLLAKNPADRPQTATELASRLAAVPTTTPWTSDRAEAWWQTHLPNVLAKARHRLSPRE